MASPQDVELEREGDQLTIFRVGQDECSVEMTERLESALRFADGVNAAFDDSQCYLAFHAGHSVFYDLFCIEIESGEVQWTSSVFAGNAIGGYSGNDFQTVTMTLRSESIVLFGASSDSMYIEEFDVETGENLCRFGTGYHDYWGDSKPERVD